MAYVVRATWVAGEGQEGAVLDTLRELAPASRAEPGCRFYQAYRDPDDSRTFHLFEIYDDEDAYAAHGASDHFRRYAIEGAIPLLASRERAFFETLDL
jgi:quinol monooxygenase YgiN